jgi:hypothetical protein
LLIAEFGWLAIAALAVPALLTAFAPRRWLGRTMVLCVVLPLIVYIGVIIWEGLTRPGTSLSLDNAVLGFSLISAILIIPWGIACALGFAVGFALRALIGRAGPRKLDPEPERAVPPAPLADASRKPSAAYSSAAGDRTSDAAEWQRAHIGFSDDGLRIGGLDVWNLRWRSIDAPPLSLAHPAYPQEQHRFSIQEIGDGPAAVRFAASELSNGVWGFYVPRQDGTDVSALSADGSLRYEQRRSDGGGAEVESRAVLTDATTGELLVDCAGWPTNRISGNADGSLFLRLRQDDGESLLRIDPAARSFRNQGENGPGRPLAELASAVRALRNMRADLPRGPYYRRISPDGTIRIDTEAVEWGNSHWVQTPRVIDIASGRVVLDLWNSDWDATISFPGNRRVALDFRRYHFSGDLAIELDLADDVYRITREPGGDDPLPSGPLAEAAEAMEASGRRVAAFAATLNGGRPVWDVATTPNPFAAWRTALLILLVAAVLIFVATWLSLHDAAKSDREPTIIRIIPKPDLPTRRPFDPSTTAARATIGAPSSR